MSKQKEEGKEEGKETNKKEKKNIKKSKESVKVIQRLLPIQYINSKGNRLGDYQILREGINPTDSTGPVNYLLSNLFEYANDKDKDTKDINEYFPHYDTDKEFKVIEYKSEEETKMEKKEREEQYKEMKELFDNLKIFKTELGDIVSGKDDPELIEIKDFIKKRFDDIKDSNKDDFEKERLMRKELSYFYNLIFGKLKELNEDEFNKTSTLTDKSEIVSTKMKAGNKIKKTKKIKPKYKRKNQKNKSKKQIKKTK